MLSRIAESLYWFGRYIERAEDTARILDEQYHLLVEDQTVAEADAVAVLLSVMGLEAHIGRVTTVDNVAHMLAFDLDQSYSIAGALAAAWENARGVRASISVEMWEAMNSTHLVLPSHVASASRSQPHRFYVWTKERCNVLAGLADATMRRDEGWWFMVLGRSLERVDMTARMLAAHHAESADSAGWAATLHCCAAYEAYLRTYHQAADASKAASFLLLERTFPRSVFSALSVAELCLNELVALSARASLADEPRRIVGQARTFLEFQRPEELMADLADTLEQVQRLVADAGEAVGERYFAQTLALSWTA